ncbi:hypothetical protein RQP46_009672 [Phenoliferia psychrophenolica]
MKQMLYSIYHRTLPSPSPSPSSASQPPASPPVAVEPSSVPSPTAAPATPTAAGSSPTLHRRHSFHTSPTSSSEPLPEALTLDLESLTLGERDKDSEPAQSPKEYDLGLKNASDGSAAFVPIDEYYGATFGTAFPVPGAFAGQPVPWGSASVGGGVHAGPGGGPGGSEEAIQRLGLDGEPYPPLAPSTGPPGTGERRYGKTKFFNAQKGFGFILDSRSDELSGDEVFVHYSAIQAVSGGPRAFRSLCEVEYVISHGNKGWQAQSVTGPNGAPCIGTTSGGNSGANSSMTSSQQPRGAGSGRGRTRHSGERSPRVGYGSGAFRGNVSGSAPGLHASQGPPPGMFYPAMPMAGQPVHSPFGSPGGPQTPGHYQSLASPPYASPPQYQHAQLYPQYAYPTPPLHHSSPSNPSSPESPGAYRSLPASAFFSPQYPQAGYWPNVPQGAYDARSPGMGAMGFGNGLGGDVFGGQGHGGVAVAGEEQWGPAGFEGYGHDFGGGATYFGAPKMPWREVGAAEHGAVIEG